MSNHKTLSFDQLHVAKLRSGIFSDRPAAQGVGDSYLSTDTFELYVCYSGTTWTLYASGGGSSDFSGLRWSLIADQSIPGDNSEQYSTWDSEDWTYGDYGTVGALALTPSLGVYGFSFRFLFDNAFAGDWTIKIWADDFTVLQTHTIIGDGSSDPIEFIVSGQIKPPIAQPTAGAWMYASVSQDSGSAMDLMPDSYMTINRMGDIP